MYILYSPEFISWLWGHMGVLFILLAMLTRNSKVIKINKDLMIFCTIFNKKQGCCAPVTTCTTYLTDSKMWRDNNKFVMITNEFFFHGIIMSYQILHQRKFSRAKFLSKVFQTVKKRLKIALMRLLR